jgi:hypothetical protein
MQGFLQTRMQVALHGACRPRCTRLHLRVRPRPGRARLLERRQIDLGDFALWPLRQQIRKAGRLYTSYPTGAVEEGLICRA